MKKFTAGKFDKSDIEISISLSRKNGIRVYLESSVERIFGNHIENYITNYLENSGISSAVVNAKDDGALDFVISSRIDAALYKQNIKNLRASSHKRKIKKQKKYAFRRTRLYIPGNNPHLIEGCNLFGADVVILDLEDAVSQNEKIDARFLVRGALNVIDFKQTEVIVRINPFSNGGIEDLNIVIPALPDAIMLPKTNSADDIRQLEAELERLEKENDIPLKTIKIFPLIETAQGVLNAQKIATASKRNVMLTFGAEDFTADIGVKKTREGTELLLARELIVLAAKAAGIQASDTVYSDIDDIEGLIKDTELSKSLGFDGRGVIHPLQIEPIHNVFAPTDEEIVYARKVIDALKEAKKRGGGVASLGRKMIDAPVAKRAKRVLELAKRLSKK